MEPLRIFGIPITRPGYYYRNSLSLAQIELMAMDCSVVDYNTGKKKKKMDTNERLREMEERGVDAEAANSAAEKWLEKYGDGQNLSIELDLSGYDIPQQKKSYTLDDLKKISEQQKE